jgi:hypothetical protein
MNTGIKAQLDAKISSALMADSISPFTAVINKTFVELSKV